MAVATVVVSILLHRAEPFVRARIVEELEQHFHAHVELDSFNMSLANGLWAEGKGLRIWPPGQAAASAPIIRLAEFRFHGPLHYAPGRPLHISLVELKGLDVDLPPGARFNHLSGRAPGAGRPNAGAALLEFQVDNIECTGARLTLETDKPGKLPLIFVIERLQDTGVSREGAMGFQAELTNPRPVGIIYTKGSFGPWVVDDPRATPITGEYRFEHADLSSFKGIAGILSSTGSYHGVLRDLTVDGETDTPDFRLTHFGNALPLRTRFHATVDATNGNTRLDPVDATLGHSHLIARGEVVHVAPVQDGANGARPGGHQINLNVKVDRGRIEDFLRLAGNSATPLLTGALTMNTTLDIPPGPAPVHQRLQMKGSFMLDGAQFTSRKMQDRINELSLRGQGKPGDVKNAQTGQTGSPIQSTMQGSFQIANGVVTLPSIEYTVPGAQIHLKGKYGEQGDALNFTGTARMQATVSQMVGGWKGLLLKPLDRYFEKGGAGTEVPIHIGGTRENPDFGIDFDRMKTTSPQRPGEPQ